MDLARIVFSVKWGSVLFFSVLSACLVRGDTRAFTDEHQGWWAKFQKRRENMMRRLAKLSVLIVAIVATSTPAWAGYANYCWKCYFPGVDRYGCLTSYGGTCGCFYACLNTCYGTYTGKACGYCVKNCSGCYHTYYCKNFFCDPCWCVCVKSSTYCVGKYGGITYCACGSAYRCYPTTTI